MYKPIFPEIPIDTVKAARAIFGRSNFYLVIGDQTDTLFSGLILDDPSRRMQKPFHSIAMLYLITFFQSIETLPDLLAADAVRKRIDWKYALHISLNHPGLKAASLCQFRQWLAVEPSGRQNLQALISRLSEAIEFNNGCVPLEAAQVIRRVCLFSRLAKIWDTLNQSIEALAIYRPDWLLTTSLPHWYGRYGAQHQNLTLSASDPESQALALEIGADGRYLLQAVLKANEPGLSELSEIRALGEVWSQQFDLDASGILGWRKDACAGCSSRGFIS